MRFSRKQAKKHTKFPKINRAKITPNNTINSGRSSIDYEQKQSHEIYIPFANQDWINPLKFNFTLKMATRSRRDLTPIVRDSAIHHVFDASFDKKCGDDNDCYTDLSVKPILLNMT